MIEMNQMTVLSRFAFALMLAFATVLLAPPPAMAEDNYLSAAPDIPLAAQLNENVDEVLVFDKPQGRIIQMSATYNSWFSTPAAVKQFYRSNLPNLGWQEVTSKADDHLTFQRESEMLQISFTAETVVFNLTPTP